MSAFKEGEAVLVEAIVKDPFSGGHGIELTVKGECSLFDIDVHLDTLHKTYWRVDYKPGERVWVVESKTGHWMPGVLTDQRRGNTMFAFADEGLLVECCLDEIGVRKRVGARLSVDIQYEDSLKSDLPPIDDIYIKTNTGPDHKARGRLLGHAVIGASEAWVLQRESGDYCVLAQEEGGVPRLHKGHIGRADVIELAQWPHIKQALREASKYIPKLAPVVGV